MTTDDARTDGPDGRRAPLVPAAEPAWLIAFRQLAAERGGSRQEDDRLASVARARAARRRSAAGEPGTGR